MGFFCVFAFLFFLGQELFRIYSYYQYNGEISPNQKKIFSFLPETFFGIENSQGSFPPFFSLIKTPPGDPSLTTGIPSNLLENEQRSVMVMVDNIRSARQHQKNIEKADIVFEALAEGGITRFLTVFSSPTLSSITEIGPVRSARDYFLEFAKPFGGIYIHAGGSDQAMIDLLSTDSYFLDLDHGKMGEGENKPFYREKTIPAPHNLYVKTSVLLKMLPETFPMTPFFRFSQKEKSSSEEIQVKKISLSPSSMENDSEWNWNEERKVFLRTQEKTPFIFEAKNFLVMEVPSFLVPNDPKSRISLENIGKGNVWIFQNGGVRKGNWKRETKKDIFSFLDEKGDEMLFLPGKTWVSVIPSEKSFTIDPPITTLPERSGNE